MTKLEELQESSSIKLGKIMFGMITLEDPTDPEGKILQLVKDTFTVDELAAVACDTAANKLEEFINSNPQAKQLVGMARMVSKEKKE
jgi:hypothetical protein